QHAARQVRTPQADHARAADSGRADRQGPADRHGEGVAGRQGGRRTAAGGAGGGRGSGLLQAPVARVPDVVELPVGAALAPRPIDMEIKSDNPEHGFQVPGEFEITAMGPAGTGPEGINPARHQPADLAVLRETVSTRESRGGKFVSVRVSFRAESREQYEVAHAVLREHPEVKWTL